MGDEEQLMQEYFLPIRQRLEVKGVLEQLLEDHHFPVLAKRMTRKGDENKDRNGTADRTQPSPSVKRE